MFNINKNNGNIELDRRCGTDFELADYIYVTTNYDIFKVMKGNRAVDQSNLRKIESSIKEVGCRLVPIQVNDNMEVVDGQHRLTVLKSLGLPVYFNFDRSATLDDVQSLNVSSKKWAIKDFIKSYAEVDANGHSYRYLELLIEKYPKASTNTLAAALFKQAKITGKVIQKKHLYISQDELEIADKTLKWVTPLVDQFKNELNYPKTTLATTLCLCYRWAKEGLGIDLNKLSRRVQEGLIRSQGWAGDVRSCLAEIDKCYNYGLKLENKVMFNRLYEDNIIANRKKAQN